MEDKRTESKMGASVSWLSSMLWAKKEIRILILGLVCQFAVSGFKKLLLMLMG